MEVTRIDEGLWRWTVPHPDWRPEEDALDASYRDVGCVYLETPDAIVLIDPLVEEGAEGDRFWRALDRDVARVGAPVSVLLTSRWHVRSAAAVQGRYPGAAVLVPAAFADEVDVPGLRRVDPGASLPGGVEFLPTSRPGQVVAWIPAHRTIVPGDVILGAPAGGLRLLPAEWLAEPAHLGPIRDAIRAISERPVERVLVSHGEPVLEGGRAALLAAVA
jgi:hypothetical protein